MPPLTAVGGVFNLPNTTVPSLFTWNLFGSPFPLFNFTKKIPSTEIEPLTSAEPV